MIHKSMAETRRLILLEESLRADYAFRTLHRRAGEILDEGRKIAWTRGGKRLVGEVIDVAGTPGKTCLRVRNIRTGRTYQISIHDYLETDQAGIKD